eukprot:9097977-Pyramimonas_sp.AAC.1
MIITHAQPPARSRNTARTVDNMPTEGLVVESNSRVIRWLNKVLSVNSTVSVSRAGGPRPA